MSLLLSRTPDGLHVRSPKSRSRLPITSETTEPAMPSLRRGPMYRSELPLDQRGRHPARDPDFWPTFTTPPDQLASTASNGCSSMIPALTWYNASIHRWTRRFFLMTFKDDHAVGRQEAATSRCFSSRSLHTQRHQGLQATSVCARGGTSSGQEQTGPLL